MSNETSDSNNDRDKQIFDSVQHQLDFEVGRIAELDTKASNLIGFTGVITSLVVASASFLGPKTLGNILTAAFFIASLVILLVSIGLSVVAYKVRKWDIPPDPVELMKRYSNSTYKELLAGLEGSMASAFEETHKKNNSKARWIERSLVLFMLGLILVSVFEVMALI